MAPASLVCPLHGHTYDLATGAELTTAGDGVRTYQVTATADGTIVIDTHAAVS